MSDLPYIVDLFAQPHASAWNKPSTMPIWFDCALCANSDIFQNVTCIVGELNDWGLSHDLKHYCKLDGKI
jgi:hypothetical protein